MTDLIILPNASNGINNTIVDYRQNCSAQGTLYFDDGVSYKKNVTKLEVFYSYVSEELGANASIVQINF